MGTILEMRAIIAAAIVSLGALAACGNDKEASDVTAALRSAAGAKLGGGASASGMPNLTREMLAGATGPLLLITLEQRNQQALVVEIAQNRGVTTYSSEDDRTISLRDGVLVATRGLGDDLMAASAQRPDTRVSAGGSYPRQYGLLDGNDQAVRLDATCSVTARAAESVEIVQIIYETTRIDESCEANGRRFDNSYWVDRGGQIRKSRQWVSPTIGSIVIEDLRR